MRPKAVQTLAWVLIYSGLLIAALGLFVLDAGKGMGGVLLAAGLVDAVVGVVLIWHRSRMKEDKTP